MSQSHPADRLMLKKFGLVMPIPLTLIAGFLYWRDARTASTILFTIAVLFLLFGLTAPLLLHPVYKVWMGFARVMGFINSIIILTVIFMLMVAPLAIFFRLIGKDLLSRKPDHSCTSYWVKRNAALTDPARYERQF